MVFVLGLCLIPFLKYLVKLPTQIDNVILYYLLFLAESVSSYFFVYKTSLLNADQKLYKVKYNTTIFFFARFVLQTITVLLLHNYTIYLLIQIMTVIAANIFNSKIADKDYPYILDKSIKLNKEEKRDIWHNITAMLSYQIGNVLVNNTDNILISVMIGTVFVGY